MKRNHKSKEPILKLQELKPQHKAFAYYYVFGFTDEKRGFRMGSPGLSYAKAYNKDYEKNRNTCDSRGSKMSKNVKIREFMGEILEENGLNKYAISGRLKEIIFEGQDKNSIQGIKHYHDLTGETKHRIVIEDETGLNEEKKSLLTKLEHLSDNEIEQIGQTINGIVTKGRS